MGIMFDKFTEGNYLARNALEVLILTDNMGVLEKVKTETSLKSTTATGAAIV